MKEIIITKSSKETQKFAAKFGRQILNIEDNKKALVIGLVGDLGSGKTTFIQGFAKTFGIKEGITSPTFIIERIYKLKTKKYKRLIHIDAYRIEKAKELDVLGFKELARNPENIILIEWADRVRKILPRNRIEISLEHFKGNKRRIITAKN